MDESNEIIKGIGCGKMEILHLWMERTDKKLNKLAAFKVSNGSINQRHFVVMTFVCFCNHI